MVEKVFTAFCGCGYFHPVADPRSVPRCPGCGKLMTVDNRPPPTKVRQRRTGKTRPPSKVPPAEQPPYQTRVRKGATFFDCSCGERVLIPIGAAERPIQCTICERFHVLDIEAPPPPAPAPKPDTSRLERAPKPKPARQLGPGEFLCPCSEVQPPRTSKTGREFTCKACGRKGRVTLENGAIQVHITSDATATPTPKPAAGPAWTCPCGAPIPAELVIAKKEGACPACGRRVVLEKHHPHASMTTIRPRFEPPTPKLRTVPCLCGTILEVTSEFVGRAVRCPACSAKMIVEWNSGAPALRPVEE